MIVQFLFILMIGLFIVTGTVSAKRPVLLGVKAGIGTSIITGDDADKMLSPVFDFAEPKPLLSETMGIYLVLTGPGSTTTALQIEVLYTRKGATYYRESTEEGRTVQASANIAIDCIELPFFISAALWSNSTVRPFVQFGVAPAIFVGKTATFHSVTPREDGTERVEDRKELFHFADIQFPILGGIGVQMQWKDWNLGLVGSCTIDPIGITQPSSSTSLNIHTVSLTGFAEFML